MEQIFLNSEDRIESALAESQDKVVTLLVPEIYFENLSEDERKLLGKKIPYLLRRYGKFMCAQSRLNEKAITTLYQKDQGKLKKVNVRMGTGYWALLGALAHAHGVSRCYLFNFLLTLDQAGVGDSIVEVLNGGVPTFHQVYRYIWQLEITDNRVVRLLEFEPNPLQTYFDYSFPWLKKSRTD
ncbi:DUF1564 domain-containing protein [Leptospira adleri]|uniref:DUF1564 domain-containing protein n=1 Tax=Leptospira adleri TaxID=2023186 RepID=A0A2M9YQ99_9LEPT|nr:DUF1564 domain-containing protein [Leptospira adleri]PJZ53701.1 hypothetical protein CH380_08940 [Leptospira adleri]PJZ61275.1 hypothetical protein CH376_14300 [Leptospira adleri]